MKHLIFLICTLFLVSCQTKDQAGLSSGSARSQFGEKLHYHLSQRGEREVLILFSNKLPIISSSKSDLQDEGVSLSFDGSSLYVNGATSKVPDSRSIAIISSRGGITWLDVTEDITSSLIGVISNRVEFTPEQWQKYIMPNL